MYNFTLQELVHYGCKSKVFALGINGAFPYHDFVQEIKKNPDVILASELGDIIPAIKYFADGKQPFLPKYRFKKLPLGKLPYTVYEAKSEHLRVYLFTDDNGVINIFGGYKVDQPKELKRVKTIIKEYHLFKLSQKK